MRLKQIISYNLKTAIPAVGILGASILSSCEKETPVRPAVTVEVPMYNEGSSIRNEDSKKALWDVLTAVRNYADQEYIDTVYMNADLGAWASHTRGDVIHDLREQILEPAISYSPKIKARGNFSFWPGAASEVPEDSLWIVQQGWTIIPYNPYQR